MNLLWELQREFGLSLIFISHDLSVVRHICHRVLVLYLGRIMELADRRDIYDAPGHPYTKALISAVPIPTRISSATGSALFFGGPAKPIVSAVGMRVPGTRCPFAKEKCASKTPDIDRIGETHQVACHFHDGL